MNMVISGAWALAFVAIVGADVVMLALPAMPLWIGIGAGLAALAAALRFTTWYPAHLQARRDTA